HVSLAAADASDPHFAPEPMTPFHLRSLYQSVRQRVNTALGLLVDRRASLPAHDQQAARAVLEAAPRVDALLEQLRSVVGDDQETNEAIAETEAELALEELRRKMDDESGTPDATS
ncbi:MAG: hypothetical protein ACOC6J_09370, partial [Spirochaetota bacterium]